MKKLFVIAAAILLANSLMGQTYQNIYARALQFRPTLQFLAYPDDSSVLMINRANGKIYRTHINGSGGGTTYSNGYALDLTGTFFSVNKTWRDSVLSAARSRATHTGTQLAATISDFNSAVITIGDPRYILNQTSLQASSNFKLSGSGFAKTFGINYDDFSTVPASTSISHILWIGGSENVFGAPREGVLQTGNQGGLYLNPMGNFISIGQQTPSQKRFSVIPSANIAQLDGLPFTINYTGGQIGLKLGTSSFVWGRTTVVPPDTVGNTYYDSTTHRFKGYRQSVGWKYFLMEGDAGGGGNNIYEFDDTLTGNRVMSGDNRSLNLGSGSSKLSQFKVSSNSTIGLSGMVQLNFNTGPNGGYTIPDTAGVVFLPNITANRTATLPTVGAGKKFLLFNQNSNAFTWQVSGTLRNASNVLITAFPNDCFMELVSDGSAWFIKSLYQEDSTIVKSPLEVIVGIKDTLVIRKASLTDSGYITKEDFATFNNKANATLNNLGSTAINASLIPATNNAITLGTALLAYSNLYLASGGVISFGSGVNAFFSHSPGSSQFITLNNASLISRITPRNTNTVSASAVAFDIDATDQYNITALAANLTINAPTGTAQEGQPLLVRIKDNGTSRTLTWNAIFRAGTDFALPTSTTAGKTMYLQFVYNNDATKWDAVGLTQGF